MHGFGSHFVAGATCITVLAVASWAGAQDGDRAVAEALFEKGRAAMEREDYDTACAAFAESNRLDPAPGTLFNQADCEEQRGHLSNAWQLFDQASSKLSETDERRAIVVERAAALKARIPHLTITLAPGAPPESKIVCDALEIRPVSLGLALPIDPGMHRIVVTAPGRPERRYAMPIDESENKEIVVEPGPSGASVAPAAPKAVAPSSNPPPASSFDKRTVGYVVGGVGVAAIGTAFVLGAVALGKKSTVNQDCDAATKTCKSQEGIDAASSGSTISTVSTVSFLVGAVATGVGAYLILSSKDGNQTKVGLTAIPAGGFLGAVREF
jgi:hypothetical protein